MRHNHFSKFMASLGLELRRAQAWFHVSGASARKTQAVEGDGRLLHTQLLLSGLGHPESGAQQELFSGTSKHGFLIAWQLTYAREGPERHHLERKSFESPSFYGLRASHKASPGSRAGELDPEPLAGKRQSHTAEDLVGREIML